MRLWCRLTDRHLWRPIGRNQTCIRCGKLMPPPAEVKILQQDDNDEWVQNKPTIVMYSGDTLTVKVKRTETVEVERP